MLNKAIIFATKAHKEQLRKVNHSPFIIHPLSVGCMLSDAGEGIDVAVAGILHDTVEDTDVTIEQIREEFGEDVAKIVDGCSENKKLSWRERKRETMEILETSSREVCVVTCADKLHNLMVSVEGIEKEGKNFFAPFNKGYDDQKWYYESIKNILERRIPNHTLLEIYIDVYNKAFGKLEQEE